MDHRGDLTTRPMPEEHMIYRKVKKVKLDRAKVPKTKKKIRRPVISSNNKTTFALKLGRDKKYKISLIIVKNKDGKNKISFNKRIANSGTYSFEDEFFPLIPQVVKVVKREC